MSNENDKIKDTLEDEETEYEIYQINLSKEEFSNVVVLEKNDKGEVKNWFPIIKRYL